MLVQKKLKKGQQPRHLAKNIKLLRVSVGINADGSLLTMQNEALQQLI
jgi:hypothetical protein